MTMPVTIPETAGTTPTGKNILPENIDSVSRFFIDKNENVWFNSPSLYSPYITENGLFGELKSGFPLIHFSFGMLTSGQGSFLFNNTRNQTENISLSNIEEADSSIFTNSNLIYGGSGKSFLTTTPIMIYQSGNKSVSLYKSHLVVYTKNTEENISAALETGSYEKIL